MATQTQPLTWEALLQLPDREDDVREEVIDGYLVPMPPPGLLHEDVVDRLRDLLKAVFPRPRFRFSGAGVVTSRGPLTVRVPDIAIWTGEAVESGGKYFEASPLLLVEVLSPSNTRKQMQRKLRDYADAEAAEVWIVSPEAGTVEVLLKNGRYETAAIATDGEISPACQPQARIAVEAVFSDQV